MRPVDRRHNVADASEMKDCGDVLEQWIMRRHMTQVSPLERQARLLPMLLQIFQPAAGEIIDDPHAVAFSQ